MLPYAALDIALKQSKIGIKWKIFIYVAVYTAIFIAVLWLLQIVFINSIYGALKCVELKSAAAEAEKCLPDLDKLKEAAERLSEKSNICCLVLMIDPDGNISPVYSCESVRECAIHSLDDASKKRLYDITREAGEDVVSYFSFNPRANAFLPTDIGINNDEPESIVLSLISHQGDYDLMILLNSFVTPLASTVSIINFILAVISVFMIILAFILAIVLSGKIVKPISKINESAKKLAEGRYDTVFSGTGYLEINELSDTLNYTACELAKVDSLKRELIANTSHDLRTPLTMIGGYAEMMRDIPGENNAENADIILKETERLTSLVNDMLDISKLESGTENVNFEVFSLTDAVSETVSNYSHFKSAEGYDIRFFADVNVIVRTDRSKYVRALCNLLNNALTYTGDDKRIDVVQTIIEDSVKPRVRISVSDTGDGIPEDKLSLIWERYYKINTEHRRSAQGSGLGLSIVRNIMTLIGGSCSAVSTQGHGSTFNLDIPIFIP